MNVILCPDCGSPHVYTRYICPKCQSSDVENIRLIEHPYCGYTGSRRSYILDSKLICPICKIELEKSRESIDSKNLYRIVGSTFGCEICDTKFDKPNLLHICITCDNEFDTKTSTYEKIFNYEIPVQVIKELRITDKIQVLSIEDNPDDIELIKIILEKSEHEFNLEFVTTGKEGLKKITEKYYDIILLDYNLPDMNGRDILEELNKRKMNIPIIVLSGTDDREIAVNSMKFGASDYMVKSKELYKNLPSILLKLIQK